MTEWATSDEANRPIICEYESGALWLWTRWRGTALSMTYIPVFVNIVIGVVVNSYVHSHTATTRSFFSVPPADDPLIQELAGLKALWEYQLFLCNIHWYGWLLFLSIQGWEAFPFHFVRFWYTFSRVF